MCKRNLWLAAAAVITLFWFIGCRQGRESAEGSREVNLWTAQLITHATGGVVPATEGIRVRFSHPMVSDGQVGKPVEERVFTFSPPLKGETAWEDRRTLRFQPDGALPLDTEFAAVLLLDHVFADPAEPFPFSFRTAGRELALVEGEFLPVRRGEPRFLTYSGKVVFTETTDRRAVEKAFAFSIRGESAGRESRLEASWEPGESAGVYLYTVTGIERTEERQILRIAAKATVLGLSVPFQREVVLEPLSSFSVVRVVSHSAGQNPEIAVTFSDEVAQNQDLEGLLRIEPYVDVRLSSIGNTVYLSGDLSFGQTYRLIANNGIRSSGGTETDETEEFVVQEDIKPQMGFLQSGVFLPSSGDRRIYFKTVNLRQVRIEVKRVFDNNLGQFLQTEQLASTRDRTEAFDTGYVHRVGITVAQELLTIGEETNVWLNHELDLRNLIESRDQGLYLISLSFEREDMIWEFDEEDTYYWGDDYYSNPNSYGYIWAHGRIYKPVIASDIGLTWKAAANQHVVLATDLLDTEPLWGADVALMSYQNQLIAQGRTDRNGMAVFPEVKDSVFYVTAVKSDQRSVIKANEMGWDYSSFDTQGEDVPPDGTRAFLYADRGVHRPGDAIYLSAIVRNDDGTFPDGHPVSLSFYNPLDQLVYEEVNTHGKDGFYTFVLQTSQDDPTGNWKVDLLAGSRHFIEVLRVETIVPFRLKVSLLPDQEKLLHEDTFFTGTLESTYLFGAPASGLEATVEALLTPREKSFPSYPGFDFTNQTMEYEPYGETIFYDVLDEEGKADLFWDLPYFYGAPSALSLVLTARVFEPGGRASRKVLSVPVEAYPAYVGLKQPEMRWGYARLGQALTVPLIVVDPDGSALRDRKLSYRIYRNDTYWWWEYDSHADFRLRYKSDSATELMAEGAVLSRSTPVSIQMTPEDWGEYFIEVEDEGGHTAGFFFRASAWAGQTASAEDGGLLTLASDKGVYHPGEKAIVSFPSSREGQLLVTVEKAHEILSVQWQPPQDQETRVAVPITDEMVPNAYVTVSLIQPHAQTLNDRPIRMYGVIPLMVEKEETHQYLDLQVPEKIEPNESFQMTVQTKNGKPTRFTMAVVDEGLLDITGFLTPDPWGAFYSKQRLGVGSYDLFSQVIGAHKGDIFRTFSVGGGDEALYAGEPESAEKKRFPPVVLFQGPVQTDDRGRAVLSFTMPNYMGSVRFMAVAASGESYGSASAAVPVRSDLVLLPTLPRVLGPVEEIRIPVSIFATRDNIGTVDVSLKAEGPVAVEGSARKSLTFRTVGEREIVFNLKSEAAVGDAKITIVASGSGVKSESVTHLEVRASSPPLYQIERKTAEPGSRVLLRIPDDGMPGTNEARLSILRRGNLDLSKRLRWLIRYPYGCIEQTTSSVFPQLYLKSAIKARAEDEEKIDANINAGIEALRKFQLSSGGFSFWPGEGRLSLWGTNYAGHFLLEAEKLGYPVPPAMVERWLLFQNGRALSTADDLNTRVYRVYLLSLAGKPAYGPMNLLMENHLHEMSDPQKWLLAAAYHLAGIRDTARDILLGAGTEVQAYSEFSGTYGSGLRDRAMMLEMAVQLSLWDTADILYGEIAERLGSEDWYSTQTLGYCLLAVGKYLTAQETPQKPLMKGKIILPDGSVAAFDSEDFAFQQEITEGFGQYLIVSIDPETTIPRVHITLEWEGVPLVAIQPEEAENISLAAVWYDEDGRPIDPTAVTQGSTIWGRLQVRKKMPYRLSLEEMALTQIVPSGWEIENLRLTGESPPYWMQDFWFGEVEYMDIRDDRISWFFDMPSQVQTLDFVVKLQAVTEGTFHLPPAVCEAMYRHDFRARLSGREVRVEGRR